MDRGAFHVLVPEMRPELVSARARRLIKVVERARLSTCLHKTKTPNVGASILVRWNGLEPSRPCERQPLKLVRLPIPPPPHFKLCKNCIKKFLINEQHIYQ